MTIFLIRHGLASAGTEDLDPGLSDVGHEQARLAAEHLVAERSPGRLVVSPLRRTRETAAPFAERTGLDLRELNEARREAQRRGLLSPDAQRLVATAQGQLFLNDLLQLFLP